MNRVSEKSAYRKYHPMYLFAYFEQTFKITNYLEGENNNVLHVTVAISMDKCLMG